MRTMAGILVGIICGFMLGIALSSFIGVIGVMVFGQPIGIKFLPYFTSMFCAVFVPILDSKMQRVTSD